MSDEPFVFVTGMFRSGTTLLARLLNAHSRIAFASDPFARLFKAFRNTVAAQTLPAGEWKAAAPLDDYYFYPQKQALMQQIQATSLDLPLPAGQLPELRAEIAVASRPFSPEIEQYLDELQGKTFAELMQSGLSIIKRAYGNADTTLVGLKEVWCCEFTNHLLSTNKGARAIHIVRDPRAVCASKNVKPDKYPWLFLARQWRKLASFTWMDSRPESAHRDRTLMIRFEDLVENPQAEIQRICSFLDLDFQESLTDPSGFKDGGGKPWFQNSSHFNNKQQFNTASIHKWKKVLREDEIAFIELLCFAEMRLLGYETVSPQAALDGLSAAMSPPLLPAESLAGWIRPFSITAIDDLIRESGLELLRRKIISGGGTLTEAEKERLCLHTEIFDSVRVQEGTDA